MKKLILGVIAASLSLAPFVTAQKQKPRGPSTATLARGKYLVENVGLCGDCHTPHNEKGEPIKEQLLRGSPLAFKPALPMAVWADKSSNIAGLSGWDKDAAIRFLMSGIASNNLPARPPMPQYRFNLQDAQAIVAYLKSLDPAKRPAQ